MARRSNNNQSNDNNSYEDELKVNMSQNNEVPCNVLHSNSFISQIQSNPIGSSLNRRTNASIPPFGLLPGFVLHH
ncbi:hypothetical protein QL285_014098 [Trifolium repens]|nr:hypothetical protein QL285_014098 [Trifolium repens]